MVIQEHTKHNQVLKTVGPQMARLLAALYDRAQTSFTLADVEDITGLQTSSASSLIRKAAKRGLVSRVRRGLFTIIPAELGSAVSYAGNPYLTAGHLAARAPYFISHASAMEIHRMVTQPQFTVFASSPKRIQSRTIQGTRFRFVFIKPVDIFGTQRYWATKQESVEVSDPERTILDGLRHPEYCGGITEVAKGFCMRQPDIQPARIVDYALRLSVGAVIRRLGYLLEFYRAANDAELSRLKKRLTATYVPLDPVLPREGPHLARWRVQLNISAEELDAVRRT